MAVITKMENKMKIVEFLKQVAELLMEARANYSKGNMWE
jgi:hypothetical protein